MKVRSDLQEIARTLAVLFQPADVVEMRSRRAWSSVQAWKSWSGFTVIVPIFISSPVS